MFGYAFVLSKIRLLMIASVLVVLFTSACSRTPEQRRQRFIKIGLEQIEKKDYARAILEFTNASQAVPTHPEAYYRLGMAHLAAGDPRRGVAFLRRAVAVDPKYAEAQIKLSELMIMGGTRPLVEDAHDQLTQLISASPNSADAMTALAASEWKLARPQDAEKHLIEALDKVPSHLGAAVSLAKVRMGQKNFAEAEKVMLSVANQMPPNASAFIALGEFYALTGRLDDSARQLRRATELEPGNAMALTDLAVVELKLGHQSAADEIFRRIAVLPNPKARSIHALFLLQSGKVDQAIQELKALADKYPADRDIRSALVTAYLSNKRTPEAEKVIEAALAANPKDVPALLQRAELRINGRNWDSAETDLEAALRQDQNSPQVHFLLARLRAGRRDVPGYRAQLNDALRVDPGFAPARLELARLETNTNGGRAALELLSRAPQNQKDTPEMIAERNWAYWALGQKAEFEKSLQAGLAAAKTPELLVQDALLKFNRKQYQESRTAANAALAAAPEDVRGLQILFLAFEAEKRSAEGITALTKYAAMNPASYAIQEFVGTVLQEHGKIDEARGAFTRAKNADPSSSAPYLSLSQLDIKAGELDRSKSNLQELLGKDPRSATAHLWLGHIAIMKNDYPTAADEYRKTIAIDSTNISAMNNLAFVLSQNMKQPDDALQYAQKARELAPRSAAVANTLGMVYYQKGLYSLAIPLLKNAVELEKTPGNTFDLGFAYFKNGDATRGRETLAAALKMDSHLPQADQARQLLASSSK